MRTRIVTTVVGILVVVPQSLRILYGLLSISILSKDGVHSGATLIVLEAGLTFLYFRLKGCGTLISWNSGILISEVEKIPEFEAFV